MNLQQSLGNGKVINIKCLTNLKETWNVLTFYSHQQKELALFFYDPPPLPNTKTMYKAAGGTSYNKGERITLMWFYQVVVKSATDVSRVRKNASKCSRVHMTDRGTKQLQHHLSEGKQHQTRFSSLPVRPSVHSLATSSLWSWKPGKYKRQINTAL